MLPLFNTPDNSPLLQGHQLVDVVRGVVPLVHRRPAALDAGPLCEVADGEVGGGEGEAFPYQHGVIVGEKGEGGTLTQP